MSDDIWSALRSAKTQGPAAVLERLTVEMRQRQDYHKLFDALCLVKKQALGLPLDKPTSFDDVPAAVREEFERTYMDAARTVGELLLADGKLSQAWVYFHAIRETDRVKAALDAYVVPRETSEQSEEYLELALFKGVHPVKGVEIMLRTHGSCNTITALDQTFARLSSEDRAACAAMMVRSLHADLLQSVQREVAQRMPFAPPATTLRALTAGRDWLFADNNYHIDVSHLHSTVRFARSLAVGAPELVVARDLAEYGSQLAPQFQYAGEPPFTDYYPAHQQYFNVLIGEDREPALAYFQQQLAAEPDANDQAMIAYVIVDLLVRIDRFSDALPIAEQHLLTADADFSAAFSELCHKAGQPEVLLRVAEARGDLVTFATALLQTSAG